MNETKWPRGPWVALPASQSGILIAIGNEDRDAEVSIADVWCRRASEGEDKGPLIAEHKAAVNLICAAPELYEALDRLVGLLGNYIGWGNTASGEQEEDAAEAAARAALAKARGEEPSPC